MNNQTLDLSKMGLTPMTKEEEQKIDGGMDTTSLPISFNVEDRRPAGTILQEMWTGRY